MAIGAIAAAIQAGASTWNEIDQIFSRRKSREIQKQGIEEIKNYLKEIDTKIDNLLTINHEIKVILKNLPEELRRIVEREDRENEIESCWIGLELRRDDIFQARLIKHGFVTNEWWLDVRYKFAIIIRKEDRADKLFDVLKYAELVHLVTRGRTVPFLKKWIGEWHDSWKQKKDELESSINELIAQWKILLDNTTYIASHNYNDDIKDISSVVWMNSSIPNINWEEDYEDEICHKRKCGEVWCQHVWRKRTVHGPDMSYVQRQKTHIEDIDSMKKLIIARLLQLTALHALVERTKIFLTSLPIEAKNGLHFIDNGNINLDLFGEGIVRDEEDMFEYFRVSGSENIIPPIDQIDLTQNYKITNVNENHGLFDIVLRAGDC